MSRRVTFQGGMPPKDRVGTVEGYVQVEHHHPDNPNIYAIVVDEKTGTFCALPLYKIKADAAGSANTGETTMSHFDHLRLLGHVVRDKITGFKGTVITIGYDLTGCIQAIVKPSHDPSIEKGEGPPSKWFDVKCLEQISTQPAIEQPTFSHVPGGFANKPVR